MVPGPAAARDPRYNSAVAVRFTGPLDQEALGGALAAVVARHEALRTTSRRPTAARRSASTRRARCRCRSATPPTWTRT
nr:hypothetical protein [Streptomyces sp. DconLS]